MPTTDARTESAGRPARTPGWAAASGPARAERAAAGAALRASARRASHGDWQLPRQRRDPVDILHRSNKGRVADLLPIRFGRMAQSPFTFLRGSAAVMAEDLSGTPRTGLLVQACGDCHLMNFGLYATPERRLVFDLNDFDETHPAPWEWDIKRLVASLIVAARDGGLPDDRARDVVVDAARTYRERMQACAGMSPMMVWYERLDMQALIKGAPDTQTRKFRAQLKAQAQRRTVDNLLPKIARLTQGRHALVDQPPVLYHVHERGWDERVRKAMLAYRESLPAERRVLLDRYKLQDFAVKVVGIGSVGTRCYIALLVSDDGHPLVLQFKEAGRSVLEPHTEPSRFDSQGQRVVVGQRLMQSASDLFLGWVRGAAGNDFYVRQLRDMKLTLSAEGRPTLAQFSRYANATAWCLARAHARSGDAAAIAGYLGKSDAFDQALARFAQAYADQTERDHEILLKAIRSGRVQARAD